MDLATGAAFLGKAGWGLRGPVSRWVLGRRAAAAQSELEELLDPQGTAARQLVRAVRDQLRESPTVGDAHIADVMRAIRTPLMDSYLRMTALEGISTRNDTQARDLIRSGMVASLVLEGVGRPQAQIAANLLEEAFYAEIAKRFRRLTGRDVARAQLLQASAVAARRVLQPASQGSMGKRVENVQRLSQVDAVQLEGRLRAYAAALSDDLNAFSIPTPTKEFQVDLKELFVNSGLQLLSDPSPREGRVLATADATSEEGVPALLATLADVGNVVLFGDPGSGKSTHSRAAALHLARELVDGAPIEAIPFRVELRNFARGQNPDDLMPLLDYMSARLKAEYLVDLDNNSLRYLLHSGRAVIFFDGLDEILDVAMRRATVRRLVGFFSAFPACNHVVTSRFDGYDEAPIPPSSLFAYARTAPFSESEVANFANWFFQRHGLGRYRQEQGLPGFLAQTEVVRDIRTNPLMLGVLCGLFASGRTVPSNRTELYRDCARMLFEQWDQLKTIFVTLVDQEAASVAVRELAHHVLLTNGEEIGLDDLEEFLVRVYQRELGCTVLTASEKARATIDAWRGRRWILVFDGHRDGRDWYRFSHRTFLEYFAAEYISYEVDDGTALCVHLLPYIRQRSPLPYIHLSTQLTSQRRAQDGDLIVTQLVDWASSSSIPVIDRVHVAVTLSEILPSLRTRSIEVKSSAIYSLLSALSEWLPRMTDVNRFLDYPYAYADLRGLGADESSISDSEYAGLETSIGGTLVEDPGVDFMQLSRVVLGLDHGGYAVSPFVDAIRDGAQRLERELEFSKWIRLVHFLRACPHMESARSISPVWRVDLSSISDTLDERLLERMSDRHVVLTDALDWEDRWSLIMLMQIPAVINAEVVSRLQPHEVFVGGWPYPMLASELAPAVAHRLVQSLCSSDPSEFTRARTALADFPLARGQHLPRDLFVSGGNVPIGKLCDLTASGYFRLTAICAALVALNDEEFVARVLEGLAPSTPGTRFFKALLSVAGSDDAAGWDAVLKDELLKEYDSTSIRSLLGLVVSDPGYVLASVESRMQ